MEIEWRQYNNEWEIKFIQYIFPIYGNFCIKNYVCDGTEYTQ